MESLQEILSKKTFTPPDESVALKDYVSRRYKTKCRVVVSKSGITLTVPSSALAGTLQLEKDKLLRDCRIKTKLFIRYGR